MPRRKTDKLLVSAYARHGDTCTGGEHHDFLRCASHHKANDYVLVAKFAYLQEAIDYCHEGARRGVRMLLVSRIAKPALTWQYWPMGIVTDGQVPANVRVVARAEVRP